MTTQQQTLSKEQIDQLVADEINNFIEYWTSDDDERDRMYRVLQNFMEEVYQTPIY